MNRTVFLWSGTLLAGAVGLGFFLMHRSMIAEAPFSSSGPEANAQQSGAIGGKSIEKNSKTAGAKIGGSRLPAQNPAEKLANFIATHSDIQEKADFCGQLIADLCAQGKSQEAYEMIPESRGLMRQQGLHAFYLKANLGNDELIGMIRKEDQFEMPAVLTGFLGKFNGDQLKAVLSSPQFEEFGRERNTTMPPNCIAAAVTLSVRAKLEDPGQDSGATLKLASDLAAAGYLKEQELYSLVGTSKNLQPFEKWDFLKSVNPKGADDYVEKRRNSLISDLVQVDGAKAMEEILKNQGPTQSSDVKSAINSWTNMEPEGVGVWYQQNISKFNQQSADMVTLAISTTAFDRLEFESARQWVDQIQDSAKRGEALKTLEEKIVNYQNFLKKSTAQAP